MSFPVPPTDPGWSPIVTWHPHPAHAGAGPAAIMKWDIAPGIIRLPRPPSGRVDPVTLIAIGAPERVGDCHSWPPAQAISGHIYPRTVRCQLSSKIISTHRCSARNVGTRSRRRESRRDGRGWGWGNARCRIVRYQGIGGWRRWSWGRGHCWRGDRGCRVTRLEQPLDHCLRNALAIEVDQLIRAQIIRSARVLDLGQNHIIRHPGLNQLDDVLHACGKGDCGRFGSANASGSRESR